MAHIEFTITNARYPMFMVRMLEARCVIDTVIGHTLTHVLVTHPCTCPKEQLDRMIQLEIIDPVEDEAVIHE